MRSAVAAGFENINLDVMYGLPGQTCEEAVADVEKAIELEPTHLSHYQLTLEPNTAFAQRPPTLPEESVMEAIESRCTPRLEQAGFERYEISAYAKPTYHCQHNLNYWQFGDYLGVGAGAHDKLSDPSGARWRRAKVANPRIYVERAGDPGRIAGRRKLTADDLVLEFLLNRGRLRDPLQRGRFPIGLRVSRPVSWRRAAGKRLKRRAFFNPGRTVGRSRPLDSVFSMNCCSYSPRRPRANPRRSLESASLAGRLIHIGHHVCRNNPALPTVALAGAPETVISICFYDVLWNWIIFRQSKASSLIRGV